MSVFDRKLETLNLVHHHVFDPVAFPPGVT